MRAAVAAVDGALGVGGPVFPLRLLSNDIGQDILSVERDYTTIGLFIYSYLLCGTFRFFPWGPRGYWTSGAS